MSISRREAIKLSGLVAAVSVASVGVELEAKTVKKSNFAELPKAKGPRVVVVGGGWSGLSVAKHVKAFVNNADVVLVEQRFEFISCPMSNLWLVDNVNLEYITHDYLQAARESNYTFFHATATGVDKKNNILHTNNGDIKYNYIVFAPGIDYDYSRWTKGDLDLETKLRQNYPAGFIPGSEHITLKNKIKNFKGGNFILTVPSGNYRCLPAPYERACIIAEHFKQNGIKGKVLLLDENPGITIKAKGFSSAFNELYKEYIEYVPNARIEKFDLANKTVETEVDEYKFEDAAFYPHVRGAKILEVAGIAKDAMNKLEADINPLTYEVNGHKNMFVSGDSRPMGFSKSGNTSNAEGVYVAKVIASKINKTAMPKWESPVTTCYSVVGTKPQKAIYVYAEYAYDSKAKTFGFTNVDLSEEWQGDVGTTNGQAVYGWAKGAYGLMFN